MRKFRVYLDGKLVNPCHECMGSYDVPNDLFPDRVEVRFATVAKVDRSDDKYEFVLLKRDNRRVIAEPIGE